MKRRIIIFIFLTFLTSLITQAKETTINEATIDSLINCAIVEFNNKNTNNAIKIGEECIAIIESEKSKFSSQYSKILFYISYFYYELGKFTKAIKYGIITTNVIAQNWGELNEDYINTLEYLAIFYTKDRKYREAINTMDKVLILKEQYMGKTHIQYILSLKHLAHIYADRRNFGYKDITKSINLLNEALFLIKLGNDKDTNNFISTIQIELAHHYADLNQYSKAIPLIENLINKTSFEQNLEYALLLKFLAKCYSSDSNYYNLDISKAISLTTKALNIIKKYDNTDNSTYISMLKDLAKYFSIIGEYDKAIDIASNAINIISTNGNNSSYFYIETIEDLAIYYSLTKNYIAALNLFQKVFENKKKLNTICPSILISPLYKIGLCHFYTQNYNEAIKKWEEAINLWNQPYLFTSTIGSLFEHQNLYLSILSFASEAYLYLNNAYGFYQKAKEYSNQSIIKTSKHFINLTKIERVHYWNKHKFWHTNMIHQGVLKFNDSSLFPIAYNSVLFSKGLLLNAEIAMRDLLSESNDTLSLKVFDELYSTQRILNKQYEILPEQRCFSIDSLENRSQELEQQLISISKVYGDYTHNLRLRWTDVRSKLLNDDIAIEFVSFSQKDSITYLAYLLKKDFDAPIYKKLITHHKSQTLNNENIYNSTHFSKLIWSKLSNELKGVKNIYFAPSGELYNIAIESLPYWEDSTILVSDKWNLYRLSSTRELALNKTLSKSSGAVVYGGLKYDAELNQLDIINNTQREFFPYNNTINKDSINMRHGVAYLPGTYDEAISIDKMLKKNHINDNLYIGEKGTETTLKTFGGRSPKILHIATHGFYWTQREARRMDFSFLNKNNRNIEDKMLSRSGLLFSGANNILSGKEIPNNIDDGILTAEEISKIDLRGLDLLVLSACQTGLGEISGEGVFGLQRGFKKAGAQSILMSLWKVDDHATQLFMTQFYKSFLNNKNKRQAYLEALHFVKNYNLNLSEFSIDEIDNLRNDGAIIDLNTNKIKPYANPKYWAAFILLDAI